MAKGITAKVHTRIVSGFQRSIVALCDTELLGKTFSQGEVVLDLKAYRSFYEGSAISEIEAIELLRNAENVNIVGEKAIAAAQKAFGAKKVSVKKIKGVPHLQFYRV